MELLTPLGNFEHLEVAIENKVDAVYGGLKLWNARNKAQNFTVEQINQVIDICHEHQIKFYLTLNTLMPYLQHLQCSRFCFNQIATGKTKTLHQIFIWILV
jgi:collagenase-like PrtC family protease